MNKKMKMKIKIKKEELHQYSKNKQMIFYNNLKIY